MNIKRVDAGQGIAWLSESVQLLLRNPQPFVLMGLVIGVGSMLPLFGPLALLILGPALYGGILYAAREQAAGRGADFPHLFRAFQQPGKLPKMLMLCLPGLAAGLIVLMLLVFFVGGALIAAGVSAAADSEALLGMTLGSGGLLLFVLIMALALFAYALVLFAIPRVMLQDIEPITAMRESLTACQRNLGAVLIFFLTLMFAVLLLNLLFAWLTPILVQLVISVVFVPVVSTALWIAAEDVFGGHADLAPPAPEVEV